MLFRQHGNSKLRKEDDNKMSMMRLDKLLSQTGFGSRKEVKVVLRAGVVSVDGNVVLRPEFKVDPEKSVVYVGSELVEYEKYIYLMMNKPAGVISATYDDEERVVTDLLPEKYGWFDLFPVGRLDKDTTGLIILTNDGGFAHRALSPKKHVEKVYIAHVDSYNEIGEKTVKAFESGITLDDGYKTMPAVLHIMDDNTCKVIIKEGKFHQIKRMFEALGIAVTSLKRVCFAGIDIDENLNPGECRPLNENEIKIIINLLSKD